MAVSDHLSLAEALGDALGVRAVVEKVRRLLAVLRLEDRLLVPRGTPTWSSAAPARPARW